MEKTTERRSRRSVILGGLAAAAGVALGRAAQPERTAAANGDPVILGTANTASATTTVTTTAGTGLVGETADPLAAGVAGIRATGETLPSEIDAGVFGFGGTSGVWGDSAEAVGVVGTGVWGVAGFGSVGVGADVFPGAAGVYSYIGDESSPGPWANVGVSADVRPHMTGVYGFIGSTDAPPPATNVAVEARAGSTNYTALNVVGKAKFSRSGRVLFTPGASARTVTMTGVSSASLILAVPQTYQAGVFVVAAAPFTNQFVIRLSKAPTVNYYVQYLVLN